MGSTVLAGDYVSINPGVTVSGVCRIGRGVTIGSGATVLDQITISEGSVIAPARWSPKDIPPGVAYGYRQKWCAPVNTRPGPCEAVGELDLHRTGKFLSFFFTGALESKRACKSFLRVAVPIEGAGRRGMFFPVFGKHRTGYKHFSLPSGLFADPRLVFTRFSDRYPGCRHVAFFSKVR
ncbi:MAG: hypothetical protein IPM81_19060 [Saprospirales bacterium]|nr:hypothetical protein [Saprospirales bacterium]